MEITVDDIYGPVVYLFHWRSDKGEMFAAFADRENAEKYLTANPEGGDVLISEIITLPIIDAVPVNDPGSGIQVGNGNSQVNIF